MDRAFPARGRGGAPSAGPRVRLGKRVEMLAREPVDKNAGWPVEVDNSRSRDELGLDYRDPASTSAVHIILLLRGPTPDLVRKKSAESSSGTINGQQHQSR